MEKFINNAPFALVLVCLIIGFVLLIKGADFFVEGSSSVAKRLHVPSIIIGLTIVAMGTSLPETAVSVSASITGNNELAVSNVVGSNIFNLMVVIGVCAMIATVNVAKETIKRDIPFSLICAGLLLILGILGVGDKSGMMLGHFDGVIFIGAFAGYIFYMIKIALKASKEGKKIEIEGGNYIVSWCFGHLVELADASSYDERYAKWRYDDLPIVPENWMFEVTKDKAQQFKVLSSLMKDKRVTELVCATDAGREGELIFRLVYNKAGCTKPFKRLWISSLEDSAIREGFRHLRDGKEYDRLYEAALSRSKADWIVGINGTRLFTTLYHKRSEERRVGKECRSRWSPYH